MKKLLIALPLAATLLGGSLAPVRQLAQSIHAETTWTILADLVGPKVAHADSDFWN